MISVEDLVYSVREQVADTSAKRPHLVILGAGASLAACRNGDANGRALPLMNNLLDVVGLRPLFEAYEIEVQDTEFERVYSSLCLDPSKAALRMELEELIRHYFMELQLPDTPTIYDYLVLALREKDAIATFNWDPFLWQAMSRSRRVSSLPQMLFLHGCATLGFCETHCCAGVLEKGCPECHDDYEPVPLLYPVTQKNYTDHPYISSQWRLLQEFLGDALVLTIFGYGAPDTDVEAMDRIRGAWGPQQERQMEEVEIIDRPGCDEQVLRTRWHGLIHTHHFRVEGNYFDSVLAKHPRRSIERFVQVLSKARFADDNPAPRVHRLKDLQEWHLELVGAEKGNGSRLPVL